MAGDSRVVGTLDCLRETSAAAEADDSVDLWAWNISMTSESRHTWNLVRIA
jgi:hypothetical protein